MTDASAYDWIVCMSGGKDSDALGIWAKFKAGPARSKRYIHTVTGHDHPLTIAHLDYVAERLGITLEKIEGPYTWITLAEKKHRFPSQAVRFCTEELKVKPLAKWLEAEVDAGRVERPLVIQGIRAEESPSRATLPEWGEDSSNWRNAYDCPIWRPLLKWTAAECFAIARKHGVDPNPLYKMGMRRVGCWPCIFVGKGELANAFRSDPELLPRLREYERRVIAASKRGAASIFAHDKVPKRFHDRTYVSEKGETFTYASIDGVYAWAIDPTQRELDFGEPPTCFSQYGLCE